MNLLRNRPDVLDIYNIGAGTRGLEGADRLRAEQVVFVGHDVTMMTRKLLLREIVVAAISQNPGHEAQAAVRVPLALARAEPILSEQEKIRTDIVIMDDLP